MDDTNHKHRLNTVCPDCPSTRVAALTHLLEPECAFRCHSIDARAPLPVRWFREYEFGLIRRGVLVRQLVDSHGEIVSVDAAGPGCLVPFERGDQVPERGQSNPTGYAATDLLVCLVPEAADGDEGLSAQSARDLVRLQRDAMHRVERLADARGRARAEHRVCALLRALSDTLTPPQRRDRLPAGLQQRDLAQLLGMRHETVCRVLGKLEERTVIARNPDGLEILDRDALDAV